MPKFYISPLVMACTALCTGHQLRAHDRETGYPGAGSDDQLAMELSSRYESRYFSEGRDALDGEPLWVNSLQLGYHFLGAEIWYGQSPDSKYDELQVSLAATHAFNNIEITAGFTYFEFPFEDGSDEELGISIVFPDMPLGTELGLDAYYSFEADGYFAEISLGREIISMETVTVSLAGLLGNNQGYVSDGHDGANHVAVALEAEIPLGSSFAFVLHTAYSWALDRDSQLEGDQQLIDFLHGSIGLSWQF